MRVTAGIFVILSIPSMQAATVTLTQGPYGSLNTCTRFGIVASCTVIGQESLGFPYTASGFITATDSDTLASIVAETGFGAGEYGYGEATLNGTHTLTGGSGDGYAQYLLRWSLQIGNAWGANGNVWSASGELARIEGASETVSGETWSDLIPMVWGEPVGYWAMVSGEFSNAPGDCCARMLASLEVVDWRGFDADIAAVPEPSALILLGLGLSLLGCRKRSGDARRPA